VVPVTQMPGRGSGRYGMSALQRDYLQSLIHEQEYEARETPESKLVKVGPPPKISLASFDVS
jgi:hypothetical protein